MSVGDSASFLATRVERNDPCPCGSGKKFKACCQGKDIRVERPKVRIDAADRQTGAHPRLQTLISAAKALVETARYSEAVPLFAEIAALQPRNAQAHYNLGLALARADRAREAVASFRRALELRPGYDAALTQLAVALEEAGQESEAINAHRKLARRAKDPLDRLQASAKALMLENKTEDAAVELRRLLARAPDRLQSRFLLAKMLSQRGLFDEAEAELTPIVEKIPKAFEALTLVRPMNDRDRPLIERMRAITDAGVLARSDLASVSFGLGKAFDDLGEYGEAMRRYDAANALSPRLTEAQRDGVKSRYDALIANYSAEALARTARPRSSTPDGDLPLLIVGMLRSGTTLTEQILSSHPAVAAGGELPFWRWRTQEWGLRAGVLPHAALLHEAARDYVALLRRIGPDALRVTDKQPLNVDALGVIALALPEAGIIHCRRNPVDTCLSIYFANLGRQAPYGAHREDLVFFYRQYERLMAHWRKVLPEDRFLEVDYESLVGSRKAKTHRLVAFAGLDWDDACLAPERNARIIKTASFWQAKQPVYSSSVERWRCYEPWLGELRQLIRSLDKNAEHQAT